SEEELASLTDGIDDKVSDAIAAQQNIFEDIWSWLNADDQIGHQVFLFNMDDLADLSSKTIQQRWENEDDWEIRGEVIPPPVCPADAFTEILSRLFGSAKQFRYDRKALQHFREHEFVRYPQAGSWLDLIREHKGAVTSLMLRDPKSAQLVLDLFHSSQDL